MITKPKDFNKSISIITVILYFLITLVRYFKDYIFKSNTIAAVLLYGFVFLLVLMALKENNNKFSISGYHSAWILIFILTFLYHNREYDWFRTAMCLLGIITFFCIGKRIYYIKYGMLMCVIFAILTATVSWYELVDYNGYLRMLSKLYSVEEVNSIDFFYRQGMVSGLTSHYSSNAFYMVSAIICLLSNQWALSISKNKNTKIVHWIIAGYLLATMLMVGKRAHFVFLIMTIFISFIMLGISRSKKLKYMFVICAIMFIGSPVIIAKVPQVLNFFVRLFNSSGGDILNGREDLYKTAVNMFLTNPIIGRGYGSFSVLMNYENPGVHNDYLQFLAEWGVAGFLICLIAYGKCLYLTYVQYREMKLKTFSVEDERLIIWSFMLQLFVAMYSLTGLPHYDFEIYMLFCLACAVPKNIMRYSENRVKL